MALTTEARPRTDLEPGSPDAAAPGLHRGRGRLGWVAVAAALTASLVLTTVVLRSDSDAPSSSTAPFADRGSIVAIDQAAQRAEASSASPFADRGSIVAIDQAAGLGHAASTAPFVDRGTITAIDHAAEAEGDDGAPSSP
jgi:hypothetical protein